MYSIEIVTHCWKYAKALAWQVDSLRRNYWDVDDSPCVTLLVWCSAIQHDGDTHRLLYETRWGNAYLRQLRDLKQDKNKIFNRAIGRNSAARHTEADWIWFCDADYFFGPNCLRELAALNPDDYTLVYPRTVHASKTHEIGDAYLAAGPSRGIDANDFYAKGCGKAIGGLQIVPGRIAREHGYCDWPKAQRPVEGDSMADTRSDADYRRKVLKTPGTPIDLSDVYRIRHSTSGLARPVGGRDKWVGN